MDGGTAQQVWADRFALQADACAELGSPLYGRLLAILAQEILAGAGTWGVLQRGENLRFGQAAPLRILGAAHRLALAGDAPQWAAALPSCGGSVPVRDEDLRLAWCSMLDRHADEIVKGLEREVQTNEVARAAALALAIAETRFSEARLVEIGASGGLNLRLDRFEVDLGGMVLGDAGSPVHLRPEIIGETGALRHGGLVLPRITERVGIDTNPLDPAIEAGRLTLMSFVWPDQADRLERVAAAIEIAAANQAESIVARLEGPGDTAEVLAEVLSQEGPTIVSHSIMWQYVPTAVRWRITEVIEEAGRRSTEASPLGWVRFEPDVWNRQRASVSLRVWPHGGDRLVAHTDYHGRWLEPF